MFNASKSFFSIMGRHALLFVCRVYERMVSSLSRFCFISSFCDHELLFLKMC